MLNYVSYIWSAEGMLIQGCGRCFTNFKNTVPERQELEELVEQLKKDIKAKTVVLLGYFPVYTKEEVT